MRKSEFTRRAPGTIVKAVGSNGEYLAFVPDPLPPELVFSSETAMRLGEAALALGELKGVGQMLPNPHLLIGPLLRREAVSSSRIEGTVTNFEQLLYYEVDPTDGEMAEDRQEVANYVRALEYGLGRLKTLPVSLRLMREIHQRLMSGVRGEDKRPGEFRDRQNMIGRFGQNPADARFVPPPVGEMHQALDRLERYIGGRSRYHTLIDLALIHYQFETIHPFLDGNGRLGRLLITLLLCERGCLTQPLLTLSDFFERHRERYVDHMLAVSRTGDWPSWVDFFLKAVADQSRAAVARCNELLALWRAYRDRFQGTGYSSNLLGLIDLLFDKPVLTVGLVGRTLGVTFHTARSNVEKLVDQGVLKEVTGRRRNRVFTAGAVLAVHEKPDAGETE
jgi:Fic family protein